MYFKCSLLAEGQYCSAEAVNMPKKGKDIVKKYLGDWVKCKALNITWIWDVKMRIILG